LVWQNCKQVTGHKNSRTGKLPRVCHATCLPVLPGCLEARPQARRPSQCTDGCRRRFDPCFGCSDYRVTWQELPRSGRRPRPRPPLLRPGPIHRQTGASRRRRRTPTSTSTAPIRARPSPAERTTTLPSLTLVRVLRGMRTSSSSPLSRRGPSASSRPSGAMGPAISACVLRRCLGL